MLNVAYQLFNSCKNVEKYPFSSTIKKFAIIFHKNILNPSCYTSSWSARYKWISPQTEEFRALSSRLQLKIFKYAQNFAHKNYIPISCLCRKLAALALWRYIYFKLLFSMQINLLHYLSPPINALAVGTRYNRSII